MNLLEGLCLELRNISFNYLRKLETHQNYLKRGKNWTQRETDLWIDQVSFIKRAHCMNLLKGLCLELRNISFNYLRKLETHWNYLKRGKNWTQRGTDLWIDQVHDKMTFDWRLRLAKSCHIDLLLATTNCTVLAVH